MKAKYTIHYEHDGGSRHLSCNSGKSSGEVLMLFHQFMQNVKDIDRKAYRVRSINRGEFNQGWTEDCPELQLTPCVKAYGKTAVKFI